MQGSLQIPMAVEPPSKAGSCSPLPWVSHRSISAQKRQPKRQKLWRASIGDQGIANSFNNDEEWKSEKISARASVMASISQVWRVLTDYEELARVVPFLEESRPVKYQNSRRLQLFQRAAFSSPFWKLAGEGVLDVEERLLPLGLREIRFKMIQGDFEEYYGRWLLEPNLGNNTCTLRFDAIVSPKGDIPELLFGHAVQVWLPLNVFSVVRAAEQIAQKRASAPGFIAAALEDDVQLRGENLSGLSNEWGAGHWIQKAVQTNRKPKWCIIPPESSLDESEHVRKKFLQKTMEKNNSQNATDISNVKSASISRRMNRFSSKCPLPYLGTASVPVPHLDPVAHGRKREPSYHPFSVNTNKRSVSEVHLRKLDVDGVLHRRVVLMVSIKASKAQVWSVLADYDHLAEILPNLHTSVPMKLAPGAPERYKRLRQVVSIVKNYISLRWEYSLDVVERKCEEIQFRKFRSDETVFQGKFILAEGESASETVLEFAVECEIPMDNSAIKLMEHTLERVVFEDLPLNFMALKERIESPSNSSTSEQAWINGMDPALSSGYSGEHVSAKDLVENFDYLREVIEYHYGTREKMFPTRGDLRAKRLSTVEKAIIAHGGWKKVAEQMGWRLKTRVRRPRGYWKDISNIKTEIDTFSIEHNLAPGVMPKKSDLRKAGRDDIRRAIEQFGGLQAVAKDLGLRMDTAVGDVNKQTIVLSNLAGLEDSVEAIPYNKKMLLDVRDLDSLDYMPSGVQ